MAFGPKDTFVLWINEGAGKTRLLKYHTGKATSIRRRWHTPLGRIHPVVHIGLALMENDILPNIYSAINFDYAEYISSISNSRPALRILEIGAGVGGTTEAILSQIVREGKLPSYSVYTYTDISPGFFPRARERFSDAPNIEYKLFDVSNDPLSQGFEADSYDLILAPYVVHATANLQQTLQNLNKVLKPDGRLLLSEPVASGEADGREWEPFVSIDRWNDDLKASGFTGADNVVYDAPMPYRYCSTIITQPEARTPSEKSLPVVLICEDIKSKLSSNLAEGLIKSGHSAIKKGLAEDIADEHNIVFALDLERPFFEDISSQNWATRVAIKPISSEAAGAIICAKGLIRAIEEPADSAPEA
ncbi:hypothetical protein IFR05_007212 [Cadophora sp. M221]|nr:hypothetical protein IFR05_007212 [Cadophora sp. M221]